MSNVKATVKESLIGSAEQSQSVSQQIRSNFYRHARKDEQTGDLFMNQDDFVNAIAPAQEDYVSLVANPFCLGDVSYHSIYRTPG